jgi:hypothetical protein
MLRLFLAAVVASLREKITKKDALDRLCGDCR